MRLNDNVTPAGQTAGFLGNRWEPERLVCDPSSSEFRVDGLVLPHEIPPLRLSARQGLREQLERHFNAVEHGPALHDYDRHARDAFGLLTSGAARAAFDIQKEPPALRERYGLNKWGQSLILARRLIEAGARLVHVNWPREGGDEAVSNPLWDTRKTPTACRTRSVRIFDIGFPRSMTCTTAGCGGNAGRRNRRVRAARRRSTARRPRSLGHVFSFAPGAPASGADRCMVQATRSADPATAGWNRKTSPRPSFTARIGHHATFPDATGRPNHVDGRNRSPPFWANVPRPPSGCARGSIAFVRVIPRINC